MTDNCALRMGIGVWMMTVKTVISLLLRIIKWKKMRFSMKKRTFAFGNRKLQKKK
jgi:hypothetical protein